VGDCPVLQCRVGDELRELTQLHPDVQLIAGMRNLLPALLSSWERHTQLSVGKFSRPLSDEDALKLVRAWRERLRRK